MTKKDFIKQLNPIFSCRGFSYKSNHFYKEVSNDTMVVFGLQKSNYGEYGYLEYSIFICNWTYSKLLI